MGIEAIVGTGLAVAGSLIGANATKKAATKAADATNAANAMQQEQYYQTREDNLPLMDLRNALLPRIQQMAQQDISTTPQMVMQEPGYQFGLNQGLMNVQNTAAARGGLRSGSTLKALTRYGNDYATTKFGEASNRQQANFGNSFNRAMAAAGLGNAGVMQTQQAGQNYANNIGNNLPHHFGHE